MKIIDYSISKNGTTKKIPIGSVTTIFSQNNSTGKTTLLKSFLYAFGFDVQNTADIDYSIYTHQLVIEFQNNILKISRIGNSLLVNEDEFDLPFERKKAHIRLFGTENSEILENILGALFIDQDYGWSIIGSGTFAGANKYSLSSLLNGLDDYNDNGLKKKIDELSSEIKKYRFMVLSAKKREKFIVSNSGVVFDNTDYERNKREISSVDERINELDIQISKINKSIADNNHFSSFISEMHLSVQDLKTDIIVPINKSTLLGFDDNSEILKYRKRVLQNERNELKKRRSELLAFISKEEGLVHVKQEADKFFDEMKDINVSGLETLINQMSKEKNDLEVRLREINSRTNKWIDIFIQNVKDLAPYFDMQDDPLVSDNKYIFMKKRPQLSGAILHKMSFLYHMAAIKVCEKKLGITFPIFIDSPGGRELLDKTFIDSMTMLKEKFRHNQLFIATIKDLHFVWSDLVSFDPSVKVFDFDDAMLGQKDVSI